MDLRRKREFSLQSLSGAASIFNLSLSTIRGANGVCSSGSDGGSGSDSDYSSASGYESESSDYSSSGSSNSSDYYSSSEYSSSSSTSVRSGFPREEVRKEDETGTETGRGGMELEGGSGTPMYTALTTQVDEENEELHGRDMESTSLVGGEGIEMGRGGREREDDDEEKEERGACVTSFSIEQTNSSS